MRMHKRLDLSHYEEWEGFSMKGNKLRTQTGRLVTPQQVITGLALLEIESELEIYVTSKILKYVRALSNIKR